MDWKKEKITGPSGETLVIFTETTAPEPRDVTGYLRASRAGLQGCFPLLESEADLQAFAKVVSDAWVEHKKLIPKLTRGLAGH